MITLAQLASMVRRAAHNVELTKTLEEKVSRFDADNIISESSSLHKKIEDKLPQYANLPPEFVVAPGTIGFEATQEALGEVADSDNKDE